MFPRWPAVEDFAEELGSGILSLTSAPGALRTGFEDSCRRDKIGPRRAIPSD